MEPLLERVIGAAERHGMFAGARRIGVAVSGGADSVCVLEALVELAPRWGLCLTVLHLDHQLRGAESRGDAEFVGSLAARLGLAIVSRGATIPREGNLEQNARRARSSFFREVIDAGAVERVATGHTRSDQAETVLFRLLRGSGTTGLAGVLPVTREGIVRPLLDVERAEVEQFLCHRGVSWREDSTNADRRFARNRIRHDVLPALARDWNPKIVAALARTAEQAAADEEYWRIEVDRLGLKADNGAVVLSASGLAALPEALARRVIRRAIGLAKGYLLNVDFRHADDVLRLARAQAGSGRLQVRELDICRSFNQIRVAKPCWLGAFRLAAEVPGTVAVPGTNLELSLEIVEKTETLADSRCVYNGGMGSVDWGHVSRSLGWRSWRPGDRYQPIGSSGVKKFKDLFQQARIPSWERCHWPVLVDGDAIVWTRRFGPAAAYAVGPETRTVLRIRESGCPDTASNELGAAGTEVS